MHMSPPVVGVPEVYSPPTQDNKSPNWSWIGGSTAESDRHPGTDLGVGGGTLQTGSVSGESGDVHASGVIWLSINRKIQVRYVELKPASSRQKLLLFLESGALSLVGHVNCWLNVRRVNINKNPVRPLSS
ncbi:hypothetical protein AMECASPLE_019970 [Ameca splendens]|uniref:Uncharacterized protein n=1 Tax=Ameca splendens TaxID=208324 RepID=A0ABV0XG72_9TELE